MPKTKASAQSDSGQPTLSRWLQPMKSVPAAPDVLSTPHLPSTIEQSYPADDTLLSSDVLQTPNLPSTTKRSFNSALMSSTRRLRAVFTIGRYSSPKNDDDVDHLYARNQEIYDFVLENIYEGEQAEHFSVVINGLSSNTDMSTTSHKHVRAFRAKLDSLDAEDEAGSNIAVLAFCNFEGFCTNITAWSRILIICRELQLVLVMLKPRAEYTTHLAGDVLQAISTDSRLPLRDLPTNILQLSNLPLSNIHHDLVRGWKAVAISKNTMAESYRELLNIMPERRNTFNIKEEESQYRVIPHKRNALTGQLGQPLRLVSYDVSRENGTYACVVANCKDRLRFFDTLLQHLAQHCQEARTCVLCPATMSIPKPESTLRPEFKEHVRLHISTPENVEDEPEDHIKGKRGKCTQARFKQYNFAIEGTKASCVLDMCERTFATHNDLVTHLVAHCVSINKCALCPEDTATSKSSYRDHVSRHFPPLIACTKEGCDRAFPSETKLREHLRAHDGANPTQQRHKTFKCMYCDFATPQAPRLEAHLRTHEDTRPRYPCPRGCGAMLLDIKISDHIKRGDCPVARAQGI